MLFQEHELRETRGTIRQRGRAELIAEDLTNLEDEDLVSLDGVEVVVHGEEDLGGNERGEGLEHRETPHSNKFLDLKCHIYNLSHQLALPSIYFIGCYSHSLFYEY